MFQQKFCVDLKYLMNAFETLQIGFPLPGQYFGHLGLRQSHRHCQFGLIRLVLE